MTEPGLLREASAFLLPLFTLVRGKKEFCEVQGSNLQSLMSKDSTSAATFGIRGSPAGEHRPPSWRGFIASGCDLLPTDFRRIAYNTVNMGLIKHVNKTDTIYEEVKTRWGAIPVGYLRPRRGGF